jgi:hypothetical protein
MSKPKLKKLSREEKELTRKALKRLEKMRRG